MRSPTEDQIYLCVMAWMLGPDIISIKDRDEVAALYANGYG